MWLKYVMSGMCLCFSRVIQLTDLSRKMENLMEQILPFQSIDADLREAGAAGLAGHDDITNASKSLDGICISFVMRNINVLILSPPPTHSEADAPAPAPSGDEYTAFSPKMRAASRVGPMIPPAHQSSVWMLDGKTAVHAPDR